MKRIMTSLTLLALLLTGCTLRIIQPAPERESSPGTEAEAADGEATVRFSIRMDQKTRSSISIDEDQLSDVNIYAYCDGLLYASAYSTTPQTVSLKLRKGCAYNLYAVANTGEMEACAKEPDFVEQCRITVPSVSDLNGKNLLAWSCKGYTPDKDSADLDMEMTRLYSRVNFMLDKGVLEGLEVKSVRLHQATRSVRPFQEGGSRAATAADVMDGDYASAGDLLTLNTTGYGIHFYTLENRQGDLLPSNSDPWKKTPESISGKEQLCTYIEVQATFKEGFFYTGNVTYRFYLGQDSTTNFDIIRNCDMTVTLSLTGDHFGSSDKPYSWKIDNGIELNPDTRSVSATLRYIRNSRDEKSIYLGQRFEMDLYLKDDVFNHLDRNINNCYVGATDRNGFSTTGLLDLSPFNPVSTEPDNNRFQLWGIVEGLGECRFTLYDKRTGQKLQEIRLQGDAQDRQAELTLESMPLTLSGSATDMNGALPSFMINGPEQTVYVYAGDEVNLNVADYFTTGSATKSSIFAETINRHCRQLQGALETGSRNVGSDINDYLTYTYHPDPEPGDGKPVGHFTVRLENRNEGPDIARQMTAALSLGSGSGFHIRTPETDTDALCSYVKKTFRMDWYPLDIDVFWDMNGEGFVYELVNPSNVPLDMDFDIFCRTTLHRNTSTRTTFRFVAGIPEKDSNGHFISYDFFREMDHWRRTVHLENSDYNLNKGYYTVQDMYHKESSSYYSLDYYYYLDLKIGDGSLKIPVSNDRIRYYTVPKFYKRNPLGTSSIYFPAFFVYNGEDWADPGSPIRGEYTERSTTNPILTTVLQNSATEFMYNDASKVKLSDWRSLFASTPRSIRFTVKEIITDPNFTPGPSHTYRDFDPHQYELAIDEEIPYLSTYNCQFDLTVDFYGQYKNCKVANTSTPVPMKSQTFLGDTYYNQRYDAITHYIGHKNSCNSIETPFLEYDLNNGFWLDMFKEWRTGIGKKNRHSVHPHIYKMAFKFGGLSIKGDYEVHPMPIDFNLDGTSIKNDHYDYGQERGWADESIYGYYIPLETAQEPWNIYIVHDMER